MLNKIRNIKKNNFLSHSRNYLIAEIFNKALGFLTIPIFTRLLMPSEYGILSIFGSIISIFTIIMGLNFHGAINRKYYEKDNDFDEFIGSNLIFLVFLNIGLLFIGFIFKNYLSTFFAIDSNIFFMALLVSSFSFFMQLEFSYLQASQQSKKYAILSVIRNMLIVIVGIVWVYLLKENRYMGRIYSQLIISAVILLFVFYNLSKISKFKFHKKNIFYSLNFGVPLIPHTMSAFILNEFDRIIINNISGSYETGIYSFAYNVGMIMMVFIGATNNAWVPIFFENIKNENYDKIQELAEKYSKIVFLSALLLILFSKEIVMIMADEKYYQALIIIPLIVIGYVFVFLYTLFGNYSFYRKKTWLISIFTFIAGVINIILNYIYIPKYGYVAAAWTTMASYLILFLLHYINCKYILKEKIIRIKMITINLTILCILIGGYLYTDIKNYIMLFLFKIFLVLLCLIIYYFKSIIKVVKNGDE